MKKSWSLSCFGILGKRGKSLKGNIKAKVLVEEGKKGTAKRVKGPIKKLKKRLSKNDKWKSEGNSIQ